MNGNILKQADMTQQMQIWIEKELGFLPWNWVTL